MRTAEIKGRGSIALKTSVTCGVIILVLLAVNSIISIRLQSGLSESMIKQFSITQKSALEENAKHLKKSLVADMSVNLGICTCMTRSFLYNFDQENLFKLIQTYLKLEGIQAIKILDADGKPFGAGWKTPEIKTGESLPESISLDENLSLVADAIHEKEKVGTVRFYYSEDQVKRDIARKESQTQTSITEFRSIAKSNIKKSVTIQVIVAAVIIVALLFTLVICLKMFVTRPIKKTIEMIKDIAQGEGDLTKRLEAKSRDEIGELSNWFNRFIERLQALIKEVGDNSSEINTASTGFSQLSASMSSGIEGLSLRSGSVSDAAEEMSAHMTSVAVAMGDASGNINMVATASEEMLATINEIAQNAEKARIITDNAVSQTQNASAQVNELGNATTQIGKVIETITDISEQVNLLALNATIEAARAGDAGKGFAVVANEIKVLATQTADASAAIKEQIRNIQSSTGNTVKEISNISEVVSQINSVVSAIASAVEEQSAATQTITQNISHASNGIGEASENVSQGSSAASQVAGEITEIKQESGSLADSSQEVKTNADKLLRLGNRLLELMGKFRV